METIMLQRFMARWTGLERAYGTYKLPAFDDTEPGEKKEGKAKTLSEPLTEEQYRRHLEGKESLGVIPITDSNTCSWGCIDIDQYAGLDLAEKARQLASWPVVCSRSKSGGLHIILFAQEPVAAKMMQAKLRELSQVLGFGMSEVFPKQTQLLADRGDVGGWLNLNYFGGDDTTRYALSPDTGEALTLEQFLDLADSKALSKKEFKDWDPLAVATGQQKAALGTDSEADPLYQGPPCLKYLAAAGIPEGTRNNVLFNMGVYLRLRYGDSWDSYIDQYNNRFFDPPMGHSEVGLVCSSLKKKEYSYTCDQAPLISHCNKDQCIKQQYGIGKAKGQGTMPRLGGLTKILTDPPTYFLEVNDKRIELSAEDLHEPHRFKSKCFHSDAKVVIPLLKRNEWDKILESLVANCSEVEVNELDASDSGQIWQMIEAYCERFQGRKEDLLSQKVWIDEETSRAYFQLPYFMAWLRKQGLLQWKQQKVVAVLKSHNARDERVYVESKRTRVWSIPWTIEQEITLPIPEGVEQEEVF